MMTMLRIVSPEELRGEFRISRQITTLGSSPENTIQIDRPDVAPVHATVLREEEDYLLIDHATEHGTHVDEVRIDRRQLVPGARIRLGSHVELVFDASPLETVVQAAGGLVIEPEPEHGPISDIHKRITLEEAGFRYETSPTGDFAKERINEKHLSTIYQVNQAITEIFSLEEIAQKVLDLIFQLFPVDRSAVILCDEKSQAPYPFSVKVRKESLKSEELSISQTVVKNAISEKSAILAADTYFDERLRHVSSIMRKHIRSVMCVPLHTRGKILGALYADSLKAPGIFSDDDLRLFFAIGGALANAIDNAWLIEQVKEDERKLTTLERYLPSAVVEHVIGKPDSLELGGKLVPISVLFADIRNFTSLAEQTKPGEVVSLLNEYFSSMADVVFKYGGTLGEYIGDEIMAYFGAPIECVDHASRAVDVALKMKEEIRLLRKRWKTEGSPVFSIGIGIATGPAIAGNIGSTKQMKYTVIGDTVNLACRLCSHADPGQILVSLETHRAAGEASNANPLGTATLKGLSRPVELYEIIQDRD
jgi:adenylate cyclase